MFIVSKKKYDEMLEQKNKEIIEKEKESKKYKARIAQLEKNRKVSKTLIEKNSRKRKKELDQLKEKNEQLTKDKKNLIDISDELSIKVDSLKEDVKRKDKLLVGARAEIIRLSKLVKKEKPTIEELKTEKCNKTDLSRLVGTRKEDKNGNK